MTRTAISPRLAMRTFLNAPDGKKRLPVLHGLSVHDELALHDPRSLALDFVHQLHGFDDAEHLSGLHPLAHPHERRRTGTGALIKGADDRRFYEHEVGIGAC